MGERKRLIIKCCSAVVLLISCLSCARGAYAASEVADAVMRRDAPALQKLLAQHANVNAAQADGATALHWAAYFDNLDAAKALIKAGAKIDVANEEGVTPMILACQSGDAAMVSLLLDAGANPNQTLAHGETLLMMAARTGNVDVLDVLMKHGVDINAKEKLRGTTALMWAAAYGNPSAVKFLAAHGADLEAHSALASRGRTPYLAPSARLRVEEAGAGQESDQRGKPKTTWKYAPLAQRLAGQIADTAYAPPTEKQLTAKLRDEKGGGLTALVFAAKIGDLQSVKELVAAGADVNGTTEFGWTPLLTATQNKNYKVGQFLLEHGAKPNVANKGGWNPLYIATDNRNIEGGDYPVRKPDLDHLAFIKLLLEHGANPNLRMGSSTETRTIFTMQWLFENGATPFLRAAQSSDLTLMKLLVKYGAKTDIPTVYNVTPLMVASGIGWVSGVTYEWSEEENVETVKYLLDHGADVNAQDILDGRTALMGAAFKGRNDIVKLLVDYGADLTMHDIGSRDSRNHLAGVTWQAIDYADGLVRVGVQSAVENPDTASLLRKLMEARGLPVPPAGRLLESICVTPQLCQ